MIKFPKERVHSPVSRHSKPSQKHLLSLLFKIISVSNSLISLCDAVHNFTPLWLESYGFLEV